MKILLITTLLLINGIACAQQKIPPKWFYADHLNWARNKAMMSQGVSVERPLTISDSGRLSEKINVQAKKTLNSGNRLALLMLDQGELVFEGYASGNQPTNNLLSYSVAKSMVSLAIGEAFCAGHIGQLTDTAEAYLPWLKDNHYGETRLVDLLHMASGINATDGELDGGEPQNGYTTRLFKQQISIRQMLLDYGSKSRGHLKPQNRGTLYEYKNLDTNVLGLVVAAATKETLPKWFEKTVLSKAQVTNSTFWILDKNNDVISHAYFSARATDYARIALYVMDALAGRHGDCLKDYLTKATTDSLSKGRGLGERSGHASYGYQFRTDLRDSPKSAFKMQGFMGQHVFFDPLSGKVLIGFSHAWDEEIQGLFSAWVQD
jgi:CubicO group peptidase (beta-lactamase class C family)